MQFVRREKDLHLLLNLEQDAFIFNCIGYFFIGDFALFQRTELCIFHLPGCILFADQRLQF